MPSYKPDLHLLERAIKSIINQSMQQWKLYLIENGGRTIPDEFLKALNDSRINYSNLETKGKPYALNFALKLASSKYIAYLDDDDIWYPNHLQLSLSYLAENKVKFLHTDAYEVTVLRVDNSLSEISRRILNLGILTDKTLVSISHINAIHERELINEAGFYDESRPFFIDWDMLIRMAQLSRPGHMKTVTCEHYIYVDKDNKQQNTITGFHKNDPELSWKMQTEMYKKSLSILTPDDFVEFISDWLRKYWQLENNFKSNSDLTNELKTAKKELTEKNAIIIELHNSGSWRMTKPLRWLYACVNKIK